MDQILAFNAGDIYKLHHQLTGRLRYSSDPEDRQPLGIVNPNETPTEDEGNKIEAGLLKALNEARDHETVTTTLQYLAKLFTNLADADEQKTQEKNSAKRMVELVKASSYMNVKALAAALGQAFIIELGDGEEDIALRFELWFDRDDPSKPEDTIMRIDLQKIDDIDTDLSDGDDAPCLPKYFSSGKMPPLSDEYPELIACMQEKIIPRVKELITPEGIESKLSFDL